jgi:hypothetical protein
VVTGEEEVILAHPSSVVEGIGFRFGAEPAGSGAIAQHAFTSNDLVVEALLSQTDLLSKHPSNEPVQASSNELE